MRLPRESLLLLVLATALCLLLGMVVGIRMDALGSGVPQASPTPAATATPGATPPTLTSSAAPILQPTLIGGQAAVLFVGVDDATAALPNLLSCWLVAYTPGVNRYYVVGIPPEAQFYLESLGGTSPLATIYSQDRQQAMNDRFVRDAVYSVFSGMTIQLVVTVDRSDMADLATKVGGLPVGGQTLAGNALLSAYDTVSFNGTTARLEFQEQAIKALFKALGDQYWTPVSLAEYLEHLPGAVRPEDSLLLTNLATSAPPLKGSEIEWKTAGDVRETATAP